MTQQVIPYKTALASLASDERYSEVLRHESLSAGIYVHHESDDQDTHAEDEFYVVVNGSGFVVFGEDRQPFGPGDLIFVPAGVHHQFQDFTPDFAVWAIFAEGGATRS
jgi:mannose-6-phosphate isomerase-like protein (cupin superfamily)